MWKRKIFSSAPGRLDDPAQSKQRARQVFSSTHPPIYCIEVPHCSDPHNYFHRDYLVDKLEEEFEEKNYELISDLSGVDALGKLEAENVVLLSL